MAITPDDFFVRLIPLPMRVRGVVEPNDDGTFSVYINSNLSYFMQRKAYEHEVRHIILDHLYVEKDITEIEAEADRAITAKHVETETRPKETKLSNKRTIRCYNSLRDLEAFLESVHALEDPIDDLGQPLW